MSSFNVLSLFVFFGIFSVLAGGVAAVFHHRLDRSARYWAIATLLSGLSVLITVFRETLPPLLGYSMPIGINIATYVLMGHGIAVLGRDAAQPSHFNSRLVYATLAFIGLLEVTRRWGGVPAALALTSVGFGAAALWSGSQAHALYLRTRCPYTSWLRWTLYALGAAQLFRIQGAFSGLATSAFAQDALNLAIYSAVFVLGMLRYLLYLAMRVQEGVDAAHQAVVHAQDAQRELAARTAFIASAMQEAPVACLVADAQGQVLIGNRAAERLLGRSFAELARPGQLPVKVEHLLIGMRPFDEGVPGWPQRFFSRSGHAGDARCIAITGQTFSDEQALPQQVLVLEDEPVDLARATDMVQGQSVEPGEALILARLDGQVLAASEGWVQLQAASASPAADGSLWETLESLQAPTDADSLLSTTARHKGQAQALRRARERSTQGRGSSSVFLRLRGGQRRSVVFHLIALSDQADKALLVEIRTRSEPTPVVAPQGAAQTEPVLAEAA